MQRMINDPTNNVTSYGRKDVHHLAKAVHQQGAYSALRVCLWRLS